VRTGAEDLLAEAIEFLAAAEWPGNVRQLRAVLREASVLAPGPVVTAELVQQAMGASTRVPSFDEARDEFTRNYLIQLLKVTRGNVSQAAGSPGATAPTSTSC